MRPMLKKIIVILVYACMTIHTCLTEEFIYPVAQMDEQNIFVVHQKSIDELSLFLWNVNSKIATKELSSMFLPSHIKILPSKTGFSFIDRGRIRIKMFQKRAPKAIDILEPIDSIVAMHWITDNQFYTVGKHRQHYKIFLCDLLDWSYQMYFLTNFDSLDYTYPFKVEDSLFCISKNEKQVYFITEQSWHPTLYGTHRADQEQSIIIESHEPLCFLHMKNKEEGYFLRCNTFNTATADFLTLVCCSCIKSEDLWIEKVLFSFKLPMKYLMGESEQRVYESIYPFLPNYTNSEHIYFVNYDLELQSPTIYTYNTKSGLIDSIDSVKRKFLDHKGLLAPLVLEESLCYGLILSSQKNIRSILKTDQETGIFNLNLPFFMLEEEKV